MQNKSHSGRFRHISAYFGIIKHILTSSGMIRHIQAYSEACQRSTIKRFAKIVQGYNYLCKIKIIVQGFIQAILMSIRRHKELNLLIEFSNSIFIKSNFKLFQNKFVY